MASTISTFDAFGCAAFDMEARSGERAVLVIEDGRSRLFQVPRSRAYESRWVLWGRRIHVFLGHSFLERKAKSTPVTSLLPFFGKRLVQDHYSCRGSCLSADHIKRFMVAAFFSSVVAFWGIKRKSVDWTGAISGFLVGLILTFSSYCFLACLLTFFITSSKATHFGSGRKKKVESDFKEGGQRNWIQVICNGGMAVEVAIIYVLEGGAGEFSLNFSSNVLRSWLATAVLSALAGVNGDTWASELATVLSKSEPRLITSFRKVPVGTNGGFTLSGLVYSALGGFVIGLAYFIALLLTGAIVDKSHQAALLIFIGVFAGIFGSVSDSIIGATLQYSGLEMRSGKVVEQPGIGVQHISGWPVLNNHSVNLIMSIINSIVVPTIIVRLYPLFL